MHGLCLALLLDASGSVDAAEWKLQVEATANALQSDTVVERIVRGGGAAISAIEFSGGQRIMVPWTSILDKQSAMQFATQLMLYVRGESGSTLAGDALLYAREYLQVAPPCERKVVDISADGWSNGGALVEEGVAANQADGTMVNAIVIEDEMDVLKKYEEAVNGFAIPATWENYGEGIKKKLQLEMAYWAPPIITPLERAYLVDYYHYGPQYARVTWSYSELTPPVEASTSNTVPIEGGIGLLGIGWWLVNRRKV